MLEDGRLGVADAGDFVEFVAAGAPGSGAFHCAGCGYGVTVQTALPRCPMCGGTTWEPEPFRPRVPQLH